MAISNIEVSDSEVDKNFEQCTRSPAEGKRLKMRSFASQFTATFAANLIKLSFGTLYGFKIIILPELYKEDSEIPMTLDQLTWFSSYCFMLPVSSIMCGILPKPIGCRMTLLLAAVAYAASGIIFYFATSAAALLVASSLVGLFYAVSHVPGASYIIEVSQPQFRSTFVASGNLFILIGSFLSVLAGSLVPWRITALVNVVFPIIGFVAVSLVPNSPYWLAEKGRFEEAEKSLAWLRGWTATAEVQDEFHTLQSSLKNKDTSVTDSSADPDNVDHPKTESNLKSKLQNYLCRKFCVPLAVILYLFTIKIFTGSLIINSYSIIIFDSIKSPMDKHVAAIILDAMRVAGAVICIFVIRATGIRKLMFASLAIGGLSLLIASLFLLLNKREILTGASSWVPTIMILLSAISSSCGMDKISFILNVELFPANGRTVGAGLGFFLYCILIALGNKVYLYCVNIMTIEGVFLVFGLAHVLGIVTFYFIIPETKGKSLKEIEEFYSKNKEK